MLRGQPAAGVTEDIGNQNMTSTQFVSPKTLFGRNATTSLVAVRAGVFPRRTLRSALMNASSAFVCEVIWTRTSVCGAYLLEPGAT